MIGSRSAIIKIALPPTYPRSFPAAPSARAETTEKTPNDGPPFEPNRQCESIGRLCPIRIRRIFRTTSRLGAGLRRRDRTSTLTVHHRTGPALRRQRRSHPHHRQARESPDRRGHPRHACRPRPPRRDALTRADPHHRRHHPRIRSPLPADPVRMDPAHHLGDGRPRPHGLRLRRGGRVGGSDTRRPHVRPHR